MSSKRCEFCNTLIADKDPFCLHELACPNNKLTYDEWLRRKEGIKKTVVTIENIIKNSEMTEKLSYKELADFLIESDFYGQCKIGSAEESKIARIVHILLELEYKK